MPPVFADWRVPAKKPAAQKESTREKDAKSKSAQLVAILARMKSLRGERAKAILSLLAARGKEAIPALLGGLRTSRTGLLIEIAELLRAQGGDELYLAVRARARKGLSSRAASSFGDLLSGWKHEQNAAMWIEWLGAKSPGLRS